MTISQTPRRAGPYDGNSLTTAFPFSFRVFAGSDVLATLTDPDGVETALNLGADYTVALVPGGGGTVNYPVSGPPMGVGYKLTITGDQPYDQTADIQNQGGFYPAVIETALDRLAIQTQQLKEGLDRSIKVAVSDPTPADDYRDMLLRAAFDAVAAAQAAQISEDKARQSELNASDSADAAHSSKQNAATSESNAQTSEGLAHQWAEEAEDTPVKPGEYSAHHWATKAASSALVAATSEGKAHDSEVAAGDSEDLARDWATKTDGKVQGEDFSAKYWAQSIQGAIGQAKFFASTQDGMNNTTQGEFFWVASGGALELFENTGSATSRYKYGTAATHDVTTSTTDTTAGRVLKVEDFGIGGPGPTIIPTDNMPYNAIFNGVSSTLGYENAPFGTLGYRYINFGGVGYSAQLATALNNSRIAFRSFATVNEANTPWSEIYHSGSFIPGHLVGEIFPVAFDAPYPPTTNPSFRYIVLTADQTGAGKYNEGCLTDETVTGSDPTITATAVVSLDGSPMDGQTIDLINSSRTFLRPGPAAGPIVDSQNKAHRHGGTERGALNMPGGSPNYYSSSAALQTGSEGGPEANPRYIPARYFMRIL